MKTSFATTNERCKGGQFVLGAMSCPGNPYDGHTLGAQLDPVARVIGKLPARAYVDRGYRGHGLNRDELDVYVSHTRGTDQPHIRSPFATAAPTSRLRRAGLRKTRPF